jgi:hypothetical protein
MMGSVAASISSVGGECGNAKATEPPRSHTSIAPPASCDELIRIALSLRERIDLGPARLFRLVGVGLSNFRDIDRPSSPLFEDNVTVEDIAVTI